ncbi:hypothetical protein QBC36DRAFT_324958 [Triangularia setosa]|uniref:Uncharacterized protein n=1 Tax=Triangularia setosa TaxID=2587417 RepID=A0AAN6WAK5_9PEZI|nr:hypothetical protein QBC36DRAFT_324958 [Podospora setosa]
MPPQTRARATAAAPASRVYESTPTVRQVQFPPRRRNVRTYGRTSTPTGMSRLLRQQTLTQIDYVQQTPPPAELREDEYELPKTVPRAAPKPKKQSRDKRRKTLGDAPSSSFHTQTITQMYPMTEKAEQNDELRIEDSQDEDDDDQLELPQLPSANMSKKEESPEKKARRLVLSDPQTPSTRRIKVNLDEVPSSQPTPFTPMLARYSPGSGHSPLRDRSINVDTSTPTMDSVTRRPRDLVIEDSFSPGGGLPSSSSMQEGTLEQARSSQKRKRQPLAEISLASMELGQEDNSTEATPTKKSCREIPDSDDELASISSTPFQTPHKSQGVIGDLGSASQLRYPDSVPSSGISNKENRTPRSGQKNVRNSNNSDDEAPGTPTPTNKKTMRPSSQKRPATQRSSQRLMSQRSASKTPIPQSKTSVAVEQAKDDDLTASEDELSELSCTPGRLSSPKAKTPTTRHNPEPSVLRSILRKTAEGPTHASPSKEPRGNTTPQLLTSESSTDPGPTTPTPIRKTVQIQLPPPPSNSLGASSKEQQLEEGQAEKEEQEIYKETPQKLYPAKSSHTPQRATQRMTQARSQFWTQGWESQRVPLSVIESLGPQTDRSDIVISIDPDILKEIIEGRRDHEFREYKFPPQVLRLWTFATYPAEEVKYMAVIGPPKQPGEIDGESGYNGNAEFNRGETKFKFAYELVQVYRLNNPVPLEDMEEHGLGKGAPVRWKYLAPAVVGHLMANLRNAVFLEPGQEVPEAEQFWREGFEKDEEEDEEEDQEGEVQEEEDEETQGTTGVPVSQQLAEQLRSDIIQSTQMVMTKSVNVLQEEEELQYLNDDTVIPASPEQTLPPMPVMDFTRPGIPRSSQGIRKQQRPSTPSTVRRVGKTRKMVGPSQATTASNYSSPITSPQKSVGTSVPRPHMPGSSELSLPDLDVEMDDDGETQLPVPRGVISSSSQVFVTAHDSLGLGMDSGNARRPPIIIFDSDQE